MYEVAYSLSRAGRKTWAMYLFPSCRNYSLSATGSHSVTCHPADETFSPYPSRSWYSISRPRGDARLSWRSLCRVEHNTCWRRGVVVSGVRQ